MTSSIKKNKESITSKVIILVDFDIAMAAVDNDSRKQAKEKQVAVRGRDLWWSLCLFFVCRLLFFRRFDIFLDEKLGNEMKIV